MSSVSLYEQEVSRQRKKIQSEAKTEADASRKAADADKRAAEHEKDASRASSPSSSGSALRKAQGKRDEANKARVKAAKAAGAKAKAEGDLHTAQRKLDDARAKESKKQLDRNERDRESAERRSSAERLRSEREQQRREAGRDQEIARLRSRTSETETRLHVLASGLTIEGTWPIRTEQPGGLRELGRNALASSILLVCRRRPASAPLATRRDFTASLRRELATALRILQSGNIAPVDLAQAAIGPGMAIFSRYERVVETDGSAMTVRSALGLINAGLDEVLSEQESDFDGDTRFALTWFEQFGMSEGRFGEAETLSKAKNTAVAGLVEAGIVASRGGRVRLLARSELGENWDPVSDERLTVWELTQYLIRALEQDGERAASELLQKVGGIGESARELAYRLYAVCERKGWPQEGLAYNGLIVAWPELAALAGTTMTPEDAIQESLGV